MFALLLPPLSNNAAIAHRGLLIVAAIQVHRVLRCAGRDVFSAGTKVAVCVPSPAFEVAVRDVPFGSAPAAAVAAARVMMVVRPSCLAAVGRAASCSCCSRDTVSRTADAYYNRCTPCGLATSPRSCRQI